MGKIQSLSGNTVRRTFLSSGLLLSGIAVFLVPSFAQAANGTWNVVTNNQLWGNSNNWVGTTVADGAGYTANFDTKTLTTSPTTVNLDSSRSIGTLLFGDVGNARGWVLANNGVATNVLTLDNNASAPVINVVNQNLNISLNLAGTNGFQKISGGSLTLSGNNSALSGTVTMTQGDITASTNNAFGSANIVINPGSNSTRILLSTAGLNLSNSILIKSSAVGGGNNAAILNTLAGSDVTLSGPITISGLATSGGHFANSNGGATGYINVMGTLTDTLLPNFISGGTGNGIVVRNGNIRLFGGGSYFRIDERAGTMQVGAFNGIATNAIVNLGGNGNGTLDLNGFSQTVEAISALIGSNTNTVTNSSTSNAVTLTIAPVASSSLVSGIVNLGFGGVISDASASAPLSINIAGDATNSNIQALTGANSYRGTTTLTSGTLSVNTLANGLSTSSIGASSNAASNLIFAGGTLMYTGGSTSTDRGFTINGGSSGTINVSTAATALTFSTGGSAATNGVLNKTGAGTLILTGTNQHTGGTNVNAGTLLVNGSGSLATGQVSVANLATLGGTGTINGTVTPLSGGTIAPGNSGVGTLTVGGLTLNSGSQLNMEFGTGNDEITVNNASALALNGGTINLYNVGTTTAFSTDGTYTLMNYNTSFSGALANMTVTATPGKTYSLTSNGSAVQVTIGDGTIVDWNGSFDGSWANSTNWSSSFPNSSSITARFDGSKLTGSANTTITLNGSKTTAGIIFNDDSSSTSYTIMASGGDTLNLDNGVADSGIAVDNGSQIISAPLAATNTIGVTFGNSGSSLKLSGAISGGKPITVSGGGTLTLTANNSYSTTSTSGGTLNVGTPGGTDTTGTLGSGNLTMTGSTTLNFNRSNSYSFSGNITGAGTSPGSVNQLGSGTTTVGGAISNVNSVNASAGSLIVSGAISQNSGVNLTGSGSLSANGGLNGAGAVTMSSSGTLTLGGTSTYSGGTTINSGLTVVNGANAFPAATSLGVNGGTLDLHGNNISINNITDSTSSTGVITNNVGSTTSTIAFAGPQPAASPGGYNIYAALNDGSGKVALSSLITNITSGNQFTLHLHAQSTYSGGTTVLYQSIEADAPLNAFGTGPISVPVNNSSINTTQIFVSGGSTINNNITIAQGNASGGVVQYTSSTSGNATVVGTVTIQADNFAGGLFTGPTASGTYLNINGPVMATNTATTIIQSSGNVSYNDTTGTSSYQFIQVNGQADLGTNNALCQTAVMQMSTSANGTFDLNGWNQTLAGLSASTNTSIIQNSGTTANTLTLNTTGTNSFNGAINDTPLGNGGQTNLTVDGTGTQVLSGSSNYTGVTTLTGNGVLQATNLQLGGSASSIGAASNAASNLVFDGGSLQYINTTTSATIDRGFTINSGKTAHIGVNTAGVNLTFTSGSSNPATNGGLEKTGAGNLTFDSTAPTFGYTGATTVSGGRLFVNNQLTNTSSISVASGATLAGSGTIGSASSTFTHTAGTINPGTIGGASNSTLTLGGNLNLAGGTVAYDVDNNNLGNPSTLQDLVTVNGNLSLTAATPIVLDFLSPNSPPPSSFTYELFQFGSSSLTNTLLQTDLQFSTNLTAGRLNAVPTLSGNTVIISVTIAPAAHLTWNSQSSGAWDTSTQNWYNTGTSAVDKFVNGDIVTFADSTVSPSGAPQTAITLAGTVSPSEMDITSNSHNYTFSGAGKISGGGVLNITGSSTTTIQTNNDFSGGTNITNASATVDVGGGGTSGSLGTGDILNNGTLKFTRTDNNGGGGITVPNNINGSGNFTDSCTGIVSFNGNINQASVAINGSLGNSTFTGSVAATGSVTISNTGTSVIMQGAVNTGTGLIINDSAGVTASGGLNGSGGITLNTTGSLTLSGSSSYDGNNMISSGTFFPNDQSAFGDTNGTTTVSGTGSIYTVQNNDYGSEAITINGTGTSSNGAIHAGGSTTSTFDGVITLGSDSLINLDGGATLFLSGTGNGTSLAGAHALTLAGTGTFEIGGSVTGVTSITAGATPLAFAPQSSTNITIGTLISGTGSMTFNTQGTPSEGSLGTTILNGSLASYTGPMTINTGNLAVTAGGVGIFTWAPSGTNGLTINGGATPTNVVGTLLLEPTSGNLPNITQAITIAARQGTSLTVPAIENMNGNNTISGAITLVAGGSEYNFQSDAGSLTIQSNLSTAALPSNRDVNLMGAGNGTLSGGLTDNTTAPMTLLKSGNGTWTIGASSSLNGGLVLSDNGALKIASGTSVSFAGVQTIAGGLSTGTNDGLYVYSGAPHIAFGGTNASLKVADSSAFAWGGSLLTVDNWTYGAGSSGDHFIVGIGTSNNTGGTGLTASQLAQIQFTDFLQGASITTTATAARSVGEITPIIGDVNGDGHVNAADIVALEKALANPSLYITERINGTGGMTASPSGMFTASDALFDMDVNGDGHATGADIQYLITYLKNGGGSISNVPEPGSFLLLALGGLLLAGRVRRRVVAR